MTIGQNIKIQRKSKNLTQKQLADMLGLAPNTIAQYELGTSRPKLEKIQLIAKALNVSVISLLPDGWDYLEGGNDPEDTEALSQVLIEAETERINLNRLQAEIDKSQKRLTEDLEPLSEHFLRKAVSDSLIALNREGLTEVYKIIRDLSEIKKYKL